MISWHSHITSNHVFFVAFYFRHKNELVLVLEKNLRRLFLPETSFTTFPLVTAVYVSCMNNGISLWYHGKDV